MSNAIRIEGLDAAIVEIRDLPPSVERRAILDMSQIAYDKMQEGAGRHRRRGDLFASVYNRSESPLRRVVGHDEQRAPHAPFVVFGAKPHEIRPKKGKTLRWVHGNGFVFARFVNHPGYRGDNYRDRAADHAVGKLPEIIDTALKEA